MLLLNGLVITNMYCFLQVITFRYGSFKGSLRKLKSLAS